MEIIHLSLGLIFPLLFECCIEKFGVWYPFEHLKNFRTEQIIPILDRFGLTIEQFVTSLIRI